MKQSLLIFLLIVFSLFTLQAQPSDSLPAKRLLLKSILPVSLIIAGSVLSGSQFEKNFQTDIRNSVDNDFYSPVDNYLMFAPIAEMYVADVAGVKSKNHWFDQTKNLFFSNLLSLGITTGLKYVINKTRPDGDSHSFPSGHTTIAFTNAAVLCNEFSGTSPVLAYSGYAFAVTTGAFRVVNNKHWLSDVLVGAGIGILATNLIYYFEPLKNFNPFKKSKNIVLVPNFSPDNYGVYFAYHF